MTSRRMWVLLADLAETEEDGAAAQEALRHIPGATPDPVWQCHACGTVHQAWHPVCDACGTTGRIKWSEPEAGHAAPARLTAPATIEGLS